MSTMTDLHVTGPDEVGRVQVHTPTYTIIVFPRRAYQWDPRARVYVANEVGRAADPQYAALAAEEAALGDLRYCTRAEFGGTHPEVDDLYDRLNASLAAAKLRVALDAIDVAAHALGWTADRAMDGARFSRNAGCDMCPCSPGVIAGGPLLLDGREADLWVELPAQAEEGEGR